MAYSVKMAAFWISLQAEMVVWIWAYDPGLQALERAGYDPGTMILSKLPLLALLTAFACAQAPSSKRS